MYFMINLVICFNKTKDMRWKKPCAYIHRTRLALEKKHAKEKASYVEIEDLDRKDLISEELFEHLYLKRVTTT